jgi:hypothetical protein
MTKRLAHPKMKRGYPVAERFADHYLPEPNSGCWLWTSGVNHAGYGRFTVDGICKKATHVALEIAGRPRPTPQHVAMHRCDVPSCVNPAHLVWGTLAENRRDCLAKDRANLNTTSIAAATRARAEAQRAATHCANGHAYTPENTSIRPNGRRRCITCRRRSDLALKRRIRGLA